MAIMLPERKRRNSAPTAPKSYAFLIGYETALGFRRADTTILDARPEDQAEYAKGMAMGHRETIRAERAFAAEQARDAELMAAEGRSRRRKIG